MARLMKHKQRLKCLTLLLCLLLQISGNAVAQGARIIEWVENSSASDNSKIALGYPVPIPVDTPLPFDGFRSYNGLHTRHQDLVMSTPWVHPHNVGSTRAGRAVWAYRLGDEDLLTPYGLPEPAMLTNGGIHAREWQSPETVTGIMELLVDQQDDHHLYRYLLENTNVILIPVLNVDGFMQSQRYPEGSWLGTDLNDPVNWPRDGRMRRKNMLSTDEDLQTQGDHLHGVDLNRNNEPFWNTSPDNSSSNMNSLVHHGQSAQSEPETMALDAAAQLGPIGQLSMYTDVHSFGQIQLWVRNSNQRLAQQTVRLLGVFSDHHRQFPAGKSYNYNGINNVAVNSGIGSTDEYFTHTYEVPAWTLEIEPTNIGGVAYGGLGRNGHDGFILPESQIRRVRTELAQTFAAAYYRQAGPPAVTAFRLIDQTTGAVVYKAEWDAVSPTERVLREFQAQPVQLGRDYIAWIAYNKPMRWREDGEVVPLPGQPGSTLDFEADVVVNEASLTTDVLTAEWQNMTPGGAAGYNRYKDDAIAIEFNHPLDTNNQASVVGTVMAGAQLEVPDMTNLLSDADPSTVARWENGAWSGYENTAGLDQTDSGGIDSTLHYQVTSDDLGDPFTIDAGTSAAWFDLERNGEGFVLEILADHRAVMYWFTYDDEGSQDWYIAVGDIFGNRIEFRELLQVSGGKFGPGFDPALVKEEVVGSASFTWSGCDTGVMDWVLNRGGQYRQGRMKLQRLTRLMGLDCGSPVLPPVQPEALLSGSWFDPSHAGEGYTLEWLVDGRALVYWFSFDSDGARRWFFGLGEWVNGKIVFEEMLTTSGGLFGENFNPNDVAELPWGSLELELQCNGGTANFTPGETGFPAGSLSLDRLTSLDQLACP